VAFQPERGIARTQQQQIGVPDRTCFAGRLEMTFQMAVVALLAALFI
jgi:hypothetical protein